MTENILELENLKLHFPIKKGVLQKTVGHVKAVDGVSLKLKKGETLGIVGESGCGKSTLARMVMQLLQPTEGQVIFENQNLNNFSKHQIWNMRQDMQMIFQDPYASLNPRMKVGEIIAAPLKAYKKTKGLKKQVLELMDIVGLKREYYDRNPHEFSGGQRQRIGIARAIALKPKVIVCDEPVSALDVSIQAQVINLLDELQKKYGLTYIFIAHDLSVVKHISDRVAVMYLGKLMEISDSNELYEKPFHPYTDALLSAIPSPNPEREKQRKRIILKGSIPSPSNPPTGCVFHTRCPIATEYCKNHIPPLQNVEGNEHHPVACFYPLVDEKLKNN